MPERPLRGMALFVLAMFLLASVDATTKILVQRLPVFEILWVRFLVLAAVSIALVWRAGPAAAFRSRRPAMQLARGVILTASMGVMVLAFRFLPIAEVQAILSVTPLIVIALSVPALGEAVGWRTWAAVAVGLCGVLLIIRPGFATFDWAVLLPLAVAATLAVYQILVKLVARRDGSNTTLVYTAVPGAVLMTAVGPFVWVAPGPTEWILLAASGLIGAGAHLALIKALEAAPASLLQPFTYLQMVVGAGYGVVLFGELPAPLSVFGAALVAGGGLYITWRTVRRQG